MSESSDEDARFFDVLFPTEQEKHESPHEKKNDVFVSPEKKSKIKSFLKRMEEAAAKYKDYDQVQGSQQGAPEAWIPVPKQQKGEEAAMKDYRTELELYMGTTSDSEEERQKPKKKRVRPKRRRKLTEKGKLYREKFLKKGARRVVCRYFKQGNCRKGADCAYSHLLPKKNPALCKFFLTGNCRKGEDCRFMHSEFPCKYFHTNVPCFAGDECCFSHEPLTDEMSRALHKHLNPRLRKKKEEREEGEQSPQKLPCLLDDATPEMVKSDNTRQMQPGSSGFKIKVPTMPEKVVDQEPSEPAKFSFYRDTLEDLSDLDGSSPQMQIPHLQDSYRGLVKLKEDSESEDDDSHELSINLPEDIPSGDQFSLCHRELTFPNIRDSPTTICENGVERLGSPSVNFDEEHSRESFSGVPSVMPEDISPDPRIAIDCCSHREPKTKDSPSMICQSGNRTNEQKWSLFPSNLDFFPELSNESESGNELEASRREVSERSHSEGPNACGDQFPLCHRELTSPNIRDSPTTICENGVERLGSPSVNFDKEHSRESFSGVPSVLPEDISPDPRIAIDCCSDREPKTKDSPSMICQSGNRTNEQKWSLFPSNLDFFPELTDESESGNELEASRREVSERPNACAEKTRKMTAPATLQTEKTKDQFPFQQFVPQKDKEDNTSLRKPLPENAVDAFSGPKPPTTETALGKSLVNGCSTAFGASVPDKVICDRTLSSKSLGVTAKTNVGSATKNSAIKTQGAPCSNLTKKSQKPVTPPNESLKDPESPNKTLNSSSSPPTSPVIESWEQEIDAVKGDDLLNDEGSVEDDVVTSPAMSPVPSGSSEEEMEEDAADKDDFFKVEGPLGMKTTSEKNQTKSYNTIMFRSPDGLSPEENPWINSESMVVRQFPSVVDILIRSNMHIVEKKKNYPEAVKKRKLAGYIKMLTELQESRDLKSNTKNENQICLENSAMPTNVTSNTNDSEKAVNATSVGNNYARRSRKKAPTNSIQSVNPAERTEPGEMVSHDSVASSSAKIAPKQHLSSCQLLLKECVKLENSTVSERSGSLSRNLSENANLSSVAQIGSVPLSERNTTSSNVDNSWPMTYSSSSHQKSAESDLKDMIQSLRPKEETDIFLPETTPNELKFLSTLDKASTLRNLSPSSTTGSSSLNSDGSSFSGSEQNPVRYSQGLSFCSRCPSNDGPSSEDVKKNHSLSPSNAGNSSCKGNSDVKESPAISSKKCSYGDSWGSYKIDSPQTTGPSLSPSSDRYSRSEDIKRSPVIKSFTPSPVHSTKPASDAKLSATDDKVACISPKSSDSPLSSHAEASIPIMPPSKMKNQETSLRLLPSATKKQDLSCRLPSRRVSPFEVLERIVAKRRERFRRLRMLSPSAAKNTGTSLSLPPKTLSPVEPKPLGTSEISEEGVVSSTTSCL